MTDPTPNPPSTPSSGGGWGLVVAALACAAILVFALSALRQSRTSNVPSRPAESAGGEAAPAAPEPLPPFRLASLDGKDLGSAELHGKVVLIDFWATWCGPCHLQDRILHDLYPGMHKLGVEFVAISNGEEPDIVRKFATDHPFPWAVVTDPDSKYSDSLKVVALPTLFVVDQEGRIVFRHDGVADGETIERALRHTIG